MYIKCPEQIYRDKKQMSVYQGLGWGWEWGWGRWAVTTNGFTASLQDSDENVLELYHGDIYTIWGIH